MGVVPDLDGVSTESTQPTSGDSQDAAADDEIMFGGGAGSAISVAVGDATQTSDAGAGNSNNTETSSVMPIVACDVARGTGDAPIIDDFEDQDFDTLDQDGRAGGWYAYDSEDDNDAVFEVTETDTATEGAMALHTAGGGFEWSGIGVGLRWGATDENGDWQECMYDASVYEGIRFWARGSAEEVRFTVSVPEVIPTDEGGSCDPDVGCWNNHGTDVTFSADWEEHFIPFSDLVQPDFGQQLGPLDAARLRTMQFEMGGQTDYDIWIDDIGFYLAENAPSTGD